MQTKKVDFSELTADKMASSSADMIMEAYQADPDALVAKFSENPDALTKLLAANPGQVQSMISNSGKALKAIGTIARSDLFSIHPDMEAMGAMSAILEAASIQKIIFAEPAGVAQVLSGDKAALHSFLASFAAKPG